MSLLSCPCTLPTEITDISTTNERCGMGEIAKIVWQRYPYSGFTTITALAEWTTLKAASDDTKVVATPLLGDNGTTESGDANTVSGLSNITQTVSFNASTMTLPFWYLTAAQLSALKSYQCEPSLGFYIVNSAGDIIAQANSGSATC